MMKYIYLVIVLDVDKLLCQCFFERHKFSVAWQSGTVKFNEFYRRLPTGAVAGYLQASQRNQFCLFYFIERFCLSSIKESCRNSPSICRFYTRYSQTDDLSLFARNIKQNQYAKDHNILMVR
jgi:hypothetical protein